MNTATTSSDPVIGKLKQDWNQLSDPDRALRIAQIKKSGLSNRKIASILGCAETLIRRLLLILHAPAADFAAARNGTLSTTELFRRTETAFQRQAAQRQANAQSGRKRQALDG